MSDQAAVSEPLSELEICQRELHLMKTSGIIEVAVRNPSVSEYMEHWERRALKAEARATALEKALANLRIAAEKQPIAGDPDNPAGMHNDWRGWWKKIFKPALDAAISPKLGEEKR